MDAQPLLAASGKANPVVDRFLEDSANAQRGDALRHHAADLVASLPEAGRDVEPGHLQTLRTIIRKIQSAGDAVNFMEAIDPREQAGQLCTCVKEKHWSRGCAVLSLGLVDFAHVIVTVYLMITLLWKEPSFPDAIKSTNVRFRVWLCLGLYIAKVVTHIGLVVTKMLLLGRGTKMQDKYGQNDVVTRWRHKQQWFVAMTFNSFLMLFVFIFVETPPDKHGPFDLVTWKKRRSSRQGRWAALRLGVDGQENGPQHDHRGTAASSVVRTTGSSAFTQSTVSTGTLSPGRKGPRVDVLLVFAKTGAGGLGVGPTYVMVTNIACTALAILINIETLYSFPAGDKLYATVSLLAVVVHFCIAAWLYLYAKMAQSQAGSTGSVSRSAAALTIGLVDTVHLVVMVLLVYALTQTECDLGGSTQNGSLTECPNVETWHGLCWIWLASIGTGMAAQAVLATLQARQVAEKSLSDEDMEEIREMSPRQKVERLQTVIKEKHYEVAFVPCGSSAPLSTDVLNGIDQELQCIMQTSGSADSAQILLKVAKDLTAHHVKAESDAFAAISFNTWMMIPALLGLKQPYSKHLLDLDKDTSPFCRLHTFNTRWLANCLIAIVTLSRTVCVAMCIYAAASQWEEYTWGELRWITRETSLFSFNPTINSYIWLATRLFVLQSAISFVTNFMWTECFATGHNDSRNVLLATLLMLAGCILDLAVLSSTSYYAACIRFPDSFLLECKSDFGDWIVDRESRIQSGTFRHIAEGMLVLYLFRIVMQTIVFWARRTNTDKLAESRDNAPLLTIVYNGIYHGTFLLVAQYPVDLPTLLTGRWSILQPRPHWTNGCVQFIVLVEKTLMGYLILELVGGGSTSFRTSVISLFTIQSMVQFFAFFFQQVVRPGRQPGKESYKPGDHIKYSNARSSDLRRVLENGGTSMEIIEVARSPADDHQTGDFKVEIRAAHAHSTHYRWISPNDATRVDSWGWRILVVLLAFLDWFHISFNLTNLVNMLTNDQWSRGGYSSAKQRVLVSLCYLCISIYSVRIVVQPILLIWRGAPLTFSSRLHKLLTAVDLIVGAVMLITGIVVTKTASLLVVIALVLLGALSIVSACLGLVFRTHEDNECWFRYSRSVHVISGLVDLSGGVAIATQREAVIAAVRPTSSASSDTMVDAAMFLLLALALSNFLRAMTSTILARLREQGGTSTSGERAANGSSIVISETGIHNDATDQWNQESKWYAALTFNTFLMLPAMMLVENPYRDSSKTVKDSFIRLGGKGWMDYLAGAVLFLMVTKKSMNGYLIVEWLFTTDGRDDTGNKVALTLLVMQFLATLYVMMVPKLAYSQRPNFHDQGDDGCLCIKASTKATIAGVGLLTIALIDWISLLVNFMSLVQWFHLQVEQSDDQCPQASLIRWIAIITLMCFVVRVCGQIIVFVCMRYYRGSLTRPQSLHVGQSNYDPDWRDSMAYPDSTPDAGPEPRASEPLRGTGSELRRHQAEEEWLKAWAHPWRQWRDLFQKLSFNSWMMVPALLFIEKPYHRNLLRRDKTSPFRRGHWAISMVYLVMLCNKTGVIIVNYETLHDECIDKLQDDRHYSHQVARVALGMTLLHSAIWFFTIFVQFMNINCLSDTDDDNETSSDEESYYDTEEDVGARQSLLGSDRSQQLPATRISQQIGAASRPASPNFSASEDEDPGPVR